MQIKPANASENPGVLPQKRLWRAADLRTAAVGQPFRVWIQPAVLGDPSADVGFTGAAGSPAANADAAMEQLSSRVVPAVRSAPVSMDPHRIVLAFNSGWLQGVTCAVVVENRRVRLRLRADGARQRGDLLRGRKILAGRLVSAGFELGGYEVSS